MPQQYENSDATATQPAADGACDKFALLSRFWREAWPARLTSIQALAWLAIWNHADRATCLAHPSARLIASYLGHAHYGRIRAVRGELAKMGMLAMVDSGGGKTSATYRLVLPPATDSVAPPCQEHTPATDLVAPGATDSDTPPATDLVAPGATDSVALTIIGPSLKPSLEPSKARRAKTADNSDGVQIPPELDTQAFRSAWGEWQEHRLQIRKKLTPLAAEKQIMQLAGWGVDRAIAAIERSIKAGWQGIFEETSNRGSQHGQRRSAAERGEFAENINVPILNADPAGR